MIEKKETDVLKKALLVLHTLNHPGRQKIISIIRKNENITVNELSKKMKLTQPKCSLQLTLLRDVGLLIRTKDPMDSRYVYHAVNESKISLVMEIANKLNS